MMVHRRLESLTKINKNHTIHKKSKKEKLEIVCAVRMITV